MDTRAELLIDELATMPPGVDIDFAYWRGRFQTLFAEPLDDDTRQTLLACYAEFLDAIERSLVGQGRDPTEFQAAREADWRTLCIQEALHRSGTDLFEPDDMHEICQREIAAGRLNESSFTELAASASRVMGRPQPTEPKKGFFKRLFG